jgi:alkanesulfonate monooxygenase SsuD/methylene tetrahydromethanopterin reductase-like flavin-dependent oxidoreductase (luciferase family)
MEHPMAPKLGYLLPTRESVMGGRPEAAPLLDLAERAEGLGFDSVWIGDSVIARPRHEPLTLLAAVAGRTRNVKLGTAVLLPALRNPVLLAHTCATLDQASEGRLILGVGIATDVPNIRHEFEACGVPFEKRVGRMLEGLRLARALWTGEPVDWEGRWQMKQAILGPTPHRKGGPPIWIGAKVEAAFKRIAREFDGWFPNGPDPEGWKVQRALLDAEIIAEGRNPKDVTGALYATFAIDEDVSRAEARMNEFMASYYGARPDVMRKVQYSYAGTADGAAKVLQAYAEAGVEHICLRFAGDHAQTLDVFANIRRDLDWS